MAKFAGHPGIEFPAWLQARGFTDESWKNDACAKALRGLNGSEHEAIRVWVEHDNPKDREIPEAYKYIVEYLANEDSHTSQGDESYTGEVESFAMEAVDELIAKYTTVVRKSTTKNGHLYPDHGQEVRFSFPDHHGWSTIAYRVDRETENRLRNEQCWHEESIVLRFTGETNGLGAALPEEMRSFFGSDWAGTLIIDEADWASTGWSILLERSEFPVSLRDSHEEFTLAAVTKKAKEFARIWAKEAPAFSGPLDMVEIEEDERYEQYMKAWQAAINDVEPWGRQDPAAALIYAEFRKVLYAEGKKLRPVHGDGKNRQRWARVVMLMSEIVDNWSDEEVAEYTLKGSFDEVAAELIGGVRFKEATDAKVHAAV